MTKRLLAIYLVLVVLIALLVPSCAGAQCTIYVQATLCGTPWQGAVNYTLTAAGGAPISGTSVQSTHTVDCGTWTCAYGSGGPANAFLDSITPLATQTVSGGGNITFTLNFELNQDAAIQFWAWSQNGVPFQGPITQIEAVPCQVIDAHFKQWVNGCPGYNVTMNETSWLNIQWTNYAGPVPGSAGVVIWVIDDPCAVNKTPTPQGLPPVKKSQVPSFNGTPVQKDMWFEWPAPGIGRNVTLDVNTQWQLVKCQNYTKSINWFGISRQWEPQGWQPHPCVLFEFVFQAPGTYTFQMFTCAKVALVDDTDVNPANDSDTSYIVTLTVNVPA